MRLPALIHVIDAVRALTACEQITVAGSAALLACDPALGDADGPLELTRDADLLIVPSDAQMAAIVHEALGEGSLFDARFGYYVDLLQPHVSQTFALGWQQRTRALAGANALAAEDIAAVKLRVGRDKDLKLVAQLLQRGLVQTAQLVELVMTMNLAERDQRAALRRLSGLTTTTMKR